MTESNSKIGFRQFPIVLKLSIVWLYLIGFGYLSYFIVDAFINFSISVIPLLAGYVFLGLAGGLARHENSSRIWTIVCVSIESLVGLIYLVGIIIYNVDPVVKIHFFGYETSIRKMQGIILLCINTLINTGILVTLLQSATKKIFSPQALQQETI